MISPLYQILSMFHKTKNHIDVEGRPWAFVGGDRDAVAPGEDASTKVGS